MEKLRFRCPDCEKLFETEVNALQSAQPQFECVACQCRFTFDYSPSVEVVIPRRLPKKVAVGPAQSASSDASRECPKCGALNRKGAEECYSCHVILAKVEGLPKDRSLRAQPSLVRKWKELLQDFEDRARHEDFLMSCHLFDAHRFAILKYTELKEAQGGDAICDEMIARLNVLMSVTARNQIQAAGDENPWLTAKTRKYLMWSPFVSSALMIVIGLSNLAYRNLVGLGVALLVLTVGVLLSTKGRISLSDFVD